MKVVTGAIIINENKVLIMRRSSNESFAGFWEFPGGKIENDENPEDCLIRELKEELQIETRIKEFFCESIYDYPKGRIKLLAYIVEIESGSIQLTVHDKMEWASRENLLYFKLLPADIPIANKIMEELSMNYALELAIGDVVKNNDIMMYFKCGISGGMRRSRKTNTLVIIADHTKGLYDDKWFNDELHYTGMGKLGDQSLDFAQNKTLAKSNSNGIEVHLFEVEKPTQYIYRGQVYLSAEPYQEVQKGEDGVTRKVWIFPLKPI